MKLKISLPSIGLRTSNAQRDNLEEFKLEVEVVSNDCTRKEYDELLRFSRNKLIGLYNKVNDSVRVYEPGEANLRYSDEDEAVIMDDSIIVVKGVFIDKKGETRQGTFINRPLSTVQVISEDKGQPTFYATLDMFKQAYKGDWAWSKMSNCIVMIHPNTREAQMSHLVRKSYYPQNTIGKLYEADVHNPIFNEVTKAYNEYKTTPGNILVTDNMKKLWELLGGKSFGVEYEVSNGNLNTALLGELGLVPVIDGSITTEYFSEYPTVILNSVEDLNTIKRQCTELTYACQVNSNCALHLHIGGVKRDFKTAVALYTLAYRIQNEMYAIVHPYKKDELATLGKKKNYSRPLNDLGLEDFKDLSGQTRDIKFRDAYQLIYKAFTTLDDIPSLDVEVPKKWKRKWDCPTRYQWFNMLNYIMGKNGTVEIRLAPPTLNINKVLPWIIINTAIVRYAEHFQDKIIAHKEKITLMDIMNKLRTNFDTEDESAYNTKVAEYCIEYIKMMKSKYRNLLTRIDEELLNNNPERQPQKVGHSANKEIEMDERFNIPFLFNRDDPNETILGL